MSGPPVDRDLRAPPVGRPHDGFGSIQLGNEEGTELLWDPNAAQGWAAYGCGCWSVGCEVFPYLECDHAINPSG